jgi:hypothetical protein
MNILSVLCIQINGYDGGDELKRRYGSQLEVVFLKQENI